MTLKIIKLTDKDLTFTDNILSIITGLIKKLLTNKKLTEYVRGT